MKKLQRQTSIEETPSLRGDGLAQCLLQGPSLVSFRYNSNTKINYLPKTESLHIVLLPLSFPEERHSSPPHSSHLGLWTAAVPWHERKEASMGITALSIFPGRCKGRITSGSSVASTAPTQQANNLLTQKKFPFCLSSYGQEHWIMVKCRGAPRLRLQWDVLLLTVKIHEGK